MPELDFFPCDILLLSPFLFLIMFTLRQCNLLLCVIVHSYSLEAHFMEAEGKA